jgi:hypothetical protein
MWALLGYVCSAPEGDFGVRSMDFFEKNNPWLRDEKKIHLPLIVRRVA